MKSPHNFSRVTITVDIPVTLHRILFFFLHPHQPLYLPLIVAIVTGMKREFTVVSVGISLMSSSVEHLFMCLLVIQNLSWEKDYLGLLPIF